MTEPVFELQLRRGLFTLTHCDHSVGDITVPAELSGHPVEAIDAGAFLNDRALTSIRLPDTVVRIDDSAFQGCFLLHSIELSKNLTYLGSFVFADCESLETVDLPDSLTFIPYGCFSICTGLEHIRFPKSLRTIGNRAFEECRALTQLDFPETLTEIGNSAFYSCLSLNTPVFPKGISAIGHSAFYMPSTASPVFDTVRLPESLTLLGSRAFRCRKLIISGRTEIDTPCLDIETIIAPHIMPDVFAEPRLLCAACAGYAEMLETDMHIDEKVVTSYEAILKAETDELINASVHCPSLMRLLIRRSLIPTADVPGLIEACDRNTDLRAELICYCENKRRTAPDSNDTDSNQLFF